ncbi:MAG TPA: CpsD/CapB family tyrosine-protein kinase, partial [Candidatus Limnocylindrales bacterium]|nr:CpsD/CapB family tyrosine-protein kinase [Candidatus Limnocylindrales bacterium]
KEEDGVEQATALDVVGRIPVPKRSIGNSGPSWALPDQAEAFLALAAQLRHRGIGSGLQTVMIASAGPGEGKTSTTLGTGAALARLGYRVIAVEADLRNPTFARQVRLPEGQGAQGLVGMLNGFSVLERELVDLDPISGLAPTAKRKDRASFGIVRSGPDVADPHRLFSSPHLPSVLGALHARADVVILDTPPLGDASDALTLAPFVDTAVFVVRLGKSREDLVARALDELRGVGIDPAGVVVVGD